MSSPSNIPSKILFFDGVCSICNRSVDFTIRKNVHQDIYFAALQSDFAIAFLSKHQIDARQLESLVFYDNGKVYSKSDAVFRLAQHLDGFWIRVFSLFRHLPRFLRNTVYNFIAINRYRISAPRKTCRIPNNQELSRFIAS